MVLGSAALTALLVFRAILVAFIFMATLRRALLLLCRIIVLPRLLARFLSGLLPTVLA